MKQYDAVIDVMERNGGYATLGFLYQHVFEVPDVNWKSRTPFASIRRIVQDPRFFFKIRPGLWALKSHREKLPPAILPRERSTPELKEAISHSYYQGVIVEAGNLLGLHTAVPAQDKNKPYLDKTLADVANAVVPDDLSYKETVRRAKTVDVVWLNQRRMPHSFFEIEHTTDIQNSLVKYVDLQDFHARFFIVAHEQRHREFDAKMRLTALKEMSGRVQFMNYDDIADFHRKAAEFTAIRDKLAISLH